MKAFICDQYGDAIVLQYKEIAKPIPKDNEILVRIQASTVSPRVIWMRKGENPDSKLFTFLLRMQIGITKPKMNILGVEFSGVVEEVGKNVHYFQKDDLVFGTTTGLRSGTYADYVCIPECNKQGIIARIPTEISFEEAAALPVGGMTALQILQKAKIQSGHKVLIYGASGSVGTFAVQIAKYWGAHVTAVCSSVNKQLVHSIGADEMIDYTNKVGTLTDNQFDVVFDAVGKMSEFHSKSLLKTSGKFLSINTLTDEKLVYINQLIKMITEKKLKIVIDRTYSFVQLADAHQYVEKGHKKGNVVIWH